VARYLLIGTVFTGAVIGVAKNNHIQVDFFYRFMPPGLSRSLSLCTDVLRIGFLASASVLTWMLMQKMGSYQMTVVNLPMNLVYSVVLLAFVMMTVRAVMVLRQHLRQGYSVLERPENA
jgi:TRAP-type C4-dicarboxylate transport system permease small subunit